MKKIKNNLNVFEVVGATTKKGGILKEQETKQK